MKSLLDDRRRMMNRTWVHNVENAERIGRMNDLLMRTVHKAIQLGKRATKSLEWMEKVRNLESYYVEVYVYPMWQNSQSDLRYERKFENDEEEEERLIDEEDNMKHTHIWNIIAHMGQINIHRGDDDRNVTACFSNMGDIYVPEEWNERDLVGEDGRTWDELIHYPAYQNQYFLMPFHHLYCDLYSYSFEDLCNINDFRITIDLQFATREQDTTFLTSQRR